MTQNTCKISDCQRPVLYHGMCNMHVLRVKRYGDPHFVKKLSRRPSDTCSQEGCGQPYYGKGLCKLHYTRQEHGQHGLTTGKCEFCGEGVPRPDARFCGKPCKMKWHRRFGCYKDETALKARGACSVADCGNVSHAHGMCRAHSKKLWLYGDPLEDRSDKPAPCIKCGADCTASYGKQAVCRKCYAMHYYYLNHGQEKSRRSARRARTKLATPKWANLEMIAAFYDACPEGDHVDHIVPLRGRKVSGLHTLENLQYLSAQANFAKRNRHPD